jgi:hypothetical protein
MVVVPLCSAFELVLPSFRANHASISERDLQTAVFAEMKPAISTRNSLR